MQAQGETGNAENVSSGHRWERFEQGWPDIDRIQEDEDGRKTRLAMMRTHHQGRATNGQGGGPRWGWGMVEQ